MASHRTNTSIAPSRGFSLVEVVIAIGIISFAVVILIGTLSSGFRGNQDVLDRSDAARSMALVANSLRAAHLTNGAHVSPDPFNLIWTNGGPISTRSIYLTDSNTITQTPSLARRRVDVTITPPPNLFSPSKVSMVVAWPASAAQISWVGEIPTVQNAQGSESLYLYLNEE